MNANTSKENQAINDVDSIARANIFSLDQKLRGFRAEVEAKLKGPGMSPEAPPEFVQKLTSLLQEVDKSLEAMDSLIKATSSDNEELRNNLLHGDESQTFNQMIAENLEKLKTLSSRF